MIGKASAVVNERGVNRATNPQGRVGLFRLGKDCWFWGVWLGAR